MHGSDASDHVATYLAAGFEAVLIGEVEQTLLEVVRGGIHADVDGLAFRGARGIEYTRPRTLMDNLDALPAPAWDQVPMEAYRAAWMERHGYFSLNIASSRGCPYQCNWCAKPIYGNSYHVRDAKAVAREVLHLKQTYAPDHIWFADDIFALSPRWTGEFAAEVERTDARVPFKMQSRCDLMTRDTVGALRRAGCAEVWMGAESGSQRILDAMDKGIRVAQVYEARRNLARHRIRACFFLQFGYPGENWSEIQATIDMVRETAPDDIGVSVSYPLPGTKFHQIVAAQLGMKKNWTESGDLMMMFRGAYSTGVLSGAGRGVASRSARRGGRGRCLAGGADAARSRGAGSERRRMKLLLTHGYFLADDAKEQKIMKPYAPLGLLYLCAHLRAKGFDVEVYDSTFGSKAELFGLLESGPAAVLGIYANLMTRTNAVEIAERARAAGWQVIAGGPEPLNYAEEYLAHGVDVIVCGEGELALEQLLVSRMDRASWSGIAGLAFLSGDGRVVRTGAPRLIGGSGCAAVAGSRRGGHRQVPDHVADASRAGIDVADHGARAVRISATGAAIRYTGTRTGGGRR